MDAHHRLILASQSPRRSELLRNAGFDVAIIPTQISEIPDENLNLADQIRDLARQKAVACLNSGKVLKGQGNLILGADTVVILDGQILGKPVDRSENAQYLGRLSGKTHSVITGVCLIEVDTGRTVVDHETSQITFRALTENEIGHYVASGDGLDKAGGYGIQSPLANRFVERVEGPFDNIVGLPVALVERILAANRWRPARVPLTRVNKMTNIEAGSAIASNIRSVKEKIAGAALVAGRKPDDIKLIAVSKTKSIDLIGEALEAGQRSFGENYVQEAVEKVAKLPSADWHFIGSLQTNKAKLVAGRFALIHSVDRVKLAEELDKAAGAAGVVQDVLLQVRVGEEDTKHGVSLDEAPRLISEILSRPNLRLKGVMSLPPLSDDESEARGYFQSVRSAFERWRDREFSDLSAKEAFTELSLGTSSDYEWAILEGATMVRVGTAIFGAREY